MEIYVKLILPFNVSDMDFLNETLLKNIKNSISEIVPKKKIGVAFSGGVDMAVEISEGCEVYYEIKTEAKGPHHCIRIAIGQLLEYAYYPPNQLIAKRLVIVSRYALDENGKQYINYIRDTLKIPIFSGILLALLDGKIGTPLFEISPL